MKNFIPQKRLIIVLIVLLFAVTLILATTDNLRLITVWTQHITARTPINVTAVPLGTINKPSKISRNGSIENATSVPVNAAFSGRLSEIYVKTGQAVKAGQPLFKLEATSESVATPTIEVSQQAQADYDKALQQFNRDQKLYAIGAIPRRQFEIATANLEAAKANLANAPKTQQSSTTIVNGAATITAPIDGIVSGIDAAPATTVEAGQKLLSLGSGQAVEVVAQIDQNDLYLVHLGSQATIEISQQIAIGQVSRIYPQVAVNQDPLFLAHIKLADNPTGLLQPGMSVNVQIDTGKTASIPAVNTASILKDGAGRNFVYLVVEGKAKRQQVLLGEKIGDFTEITSELPLDSLIITSNLNELRDGAAISLQ